MVQNFCAKFITTKVGSGQHAVCPVYMLGQISKPQPKLRDDWVFVGKNAPGGKPNLEQGGPKGIAGTSVVGAAASGNSTRGCSAKNDFQMCLKKVREYSHVGVLTWK